MKQTDKNHFNLLEPTDEFSLDPLNENVEALERALAGKGDCDLRAETFQGDDEDGREFVLGFRPKALVLMGRASDRMVVVIMMDGYGISVGGDGVNTVQPATFTDRGFILTYADNFNRSAYKSAYLAFS